MKKNYLLIFLFLLNLNLFAQNIGIGTSSPNANAKLDVFDNSKGVLIPRMDSTARKNIPNTKGLVVYDSTYNSFWFNNGFQWQKLPAGNAGATAMSAGENPGDILYWTGTAWQSLSGGLPGQVLGVGNNGYPKWITTKDSTTIGNIYFDNSTDNSPYKAGLGLLYARFSVAGPDGENSCFVQNNDGGDCSLLKNLWILQEITTDEAVLAWGDPGVQPLNQSNFQSSNIFFSKTYQVLRALIKSSNDYLSQTTDAKLNEAGENATTKNKVAVYRAEARFLRALTYYYALDLFGGFEMMTENNAPGVLPAYANSTTLAGFIETELLAIEPTLLAAKTNEYSRADKAAAWMLLAKLYLNDVKYTGVNRYTDCITQVNKIIATPGYTLVVPYANLFLADNHSNGAQNEIIFPIRFDGTTLKTWGATSFILHGQVGGSMVAANYGIDGGWWGLRTRAESSNKMQATGVSDQRNKLYTSGQNINVTNLQDFSNGYALGKFKNKTSANANGSSLSFADVDFPLFRLADVYLMYAEAVLRGGTGGSSANALTYVNLLRTRAGLSDISLGTMTLDYILDERLRELYWEGHRRTDLVRYNLFAGGTYLWQWKGGSYGGTATPAAHNTFPVPPSAISNNPNVPPTPGY
ncbi:RagB/SusD family nutrient uptake outer membrane protein [Ferruginibacter sp. SUN002]|uniref:RagB/SusD family nutrient uptake outer membrane protein n=1 Tax=Ferruginibacter sp. SUN002 TaxID=2937789 RepID=UPI003D363326